MDVQKHVTARRAQLAQQERELATQRDVQEAAHQAALRTQKHEALDEIAADLSMDNVTIKREGDHLAIVDQPLPPLDVTGLRADEIRELLQREARKRWTPGENWLVIGCIVAGICVTPAMPFALLALFFGLWRRDKLLKRYSADVRADYPDIFGPPAPGQSDQATSYLG